MIQEGQAKLALEMPKKISADAEVFYNPVMKLNRDIAVLLLQSIDKKQMQIADPLAGSGVRSIRFLKELEESKIKSVSINDYYKKSVANIKKNLDLNNIKSKVTIHNTEATKFLLDSSGFDYIDIDPFGYPGPFIDAACRRISRDGIIAVTATDTAALSGTFQDACLRKYWSKPLRNDMMHETGLRILARRVQLIGASYEKALLPIYSHATEHYMRIYFHVKKSNNAIKDIFNLFGRLNFCQSCLARSTEAKIPCSCKKTLDRTGELWLGQLWDEELASKMAKNNKEEANQKFLDIIAEESKVSVPYIYDLHALAKKHKLALLKKEEVIKKLKSYGTAPTHISPTAIRTRAPFKEIIKAFS